jgi:hypothetical protein
MKLKLYILGFVLLFSVGACFSQDNRFYSDEDYESIIGIMPLDGKSWEFVSEEELMKFKERRIIDLKNYIIKGSLSMEQEIRIREQIWRFENAIVAESK